MAPADATQRAVKADTFNSWSAHRIRAARNNGSDSGTVTPTDMGSGNNSGDAITTNSDVDCAALSEQFVDAVRAMPRTCSSNADCKLVSKAQVCDCDLAVTTSTDTSTYDQIRAQLDAGQCSNPFGCPTGECPYRRLADRGELVANCGDEGMCEVVQVLSCEEYEANAHGGIVASGSCMDDTQCQLRNDLNPCGCQEAISANFPFLTVQATQDMMDINDARCNVQCMGCPTPGDAVCANDAEGFKVCQSM